MLLPHCAPPCPVGLTSSHHKRRLMLDCPITPSDALPDLMSIGHLLPPRLQAPNLVFYSPLPYSLALYHTMAASSHLTNALPYRGPCIGSKNSPAGQYQWLPTSTQGGGAR